MEISEYDEYIPDKELDTNFKIPRKRTAQDSFGAQAGEAFNEYYSQAFQAVNANQLAARYAQSPNTATQPPNVTQSAAAYAQYASLSGAASQASAYTNSKPPVQYSVPAPMAAMLKLASKPPPPPPPPSNYGGNTTGVGSTNSLYSQKPPAIPDPYSATSSMAESNFSGAPNTMRNERGLPNRNWGGASNNNLGGDSNSNMGGASSTNLGGASSSNLGGTSNNTLGGNLIRNWGGPSNSNLGGSSSSNQGGTSNNTLGGTLNRNWGGAPSSNLGGASSSNLGGGSSSNLGGTSHNTLGGTLRRNWGGASSSNLGGGSSINQGGTSNNTLGGTLNRNWGGAPSSNLGGASSSNLGGASSSNLGRASTTNLGGSSNNTLRGTFNRNWGGSSDSILDRTSNSYSSGASNNNFGRNSQDTYDEVSNISNSRNVGVTNRNWGLSNSNRDGNRNFGAASANKWGSGNRNDYDGDDFPSENVGGFNKSWGGASNRNWGGSNHDSYTENSTGLFGTGNKTFGASLSRKYTVDPYNDDPVYPYTGNNSGGYNSGNTRGNFNNEENRFSGGRGRGGSGFGRGAVGGKWGNNMEGYNDQDSYGKGQGFGNRQSSWNQKGSFDKEDQNNDSWNNRPGGFNGRGRGAMQDWRGNKRGSFRGGRGNNFGGNRNFDKGNSGQKQWKEKPKNVRQSFSTPIIIPDATDETLPQELRSLFQPLFCKLCSLQMSSNIMATLHYKSKNHEKKIRKFLVEHAAKTGEPLHPRATTLASQGKKEKEEDTDPKHFHCDICDLPLTGKQHAESHYMGKSHNAVLMGKAPAGKGHYDANGKWVRDKTELKLAVEEAGDTFGLDFRKKTDESSEPAEVATVATTDTKTSDFACSICSVTCTNQDQINMHFSGAKHKKKLKLLGISPENFTQKDPDAEDGSKTPTAEGEPANFEMDSNDATAVERNDYSRYKTPSGFFYCEKCNLTLNSEVQLKQHLTSKNHLKKKVKKTE